MARAFDSNIHLAGLCSAGNKFNHIRARMFLAGVELTTMNIERFASSAALARLSHQRPNGVSTLYGCKHQKDLLRSIKKR